MRRFALSEHEMPGTIRGAIIASMVTGGVCALLVGTAIVLIVASFVVTSGWGAIGVPFYGAFMIGAAGLFVGNVLQIPGLARGERPARKRATVFAIITLVAGVLLYLMLGYPDRPFSVIGLCPILLFFSSLTTLILIWIPGAGLRHFDVGPRRSEPTA